MNELRQGSERPNRRIPTTAEQAAAAREHVWRRAERDIIRREKVRLFRLGVIRPAGLPNIMAKDKDGRWWPNSNFTEQVFPRGQG